MRAGPSTLQLTTAVTELMRDATEGINDLANRMIETLYGPQPHAFAVLDDWARNSARLFNQPIDSLATRAASLRALKDNPVSTILLSNIGL
jgi:hypothetical protein